MGVDRPPLPVDQRLVPEPDDTALFHDLRRRLAADVLAGAERGDMAVALSTLRFLAEQGASEKVRGKAAADLARVLAGTASAKQATVNVGTVAVVTAADLLAGVDASALRAATSALIAARQAREIPAEASVGPASPQEAPRALGSEEAGPRRGVGGAGSEGDGEAGTKGTPFPSVTANPVPREEPGPAPW